MGCHGRNEADCIANGQTIKCQANEEVCQVTTRERDGKSESYQSMCKQQLACENNSAQNKDQCRPGEKGPSVCRSCSGAPDKKRRSKPLCHQIIQFIFCIISNKNNICYR